MTKHEKRDKHVQEEENIEKLRPEDLKIKNEQGSKGQKSSGHVKYPKSDEK